MKFVRSVDDRVSVDYWVPYPRCLEEEHVLHFTKGRAEERFSGQLHS